MACFRPIPTLLLAGGLMTIGLAHPVATLAGGHCRDRYVAVPAERVVRLAEPTRSILVERRMVVSDVVDSVVDEDEGIEDAADGADDKGLAGDVEATENGYAYKGLNPSPDAPKKVAPKAVNPSPQTKAIAAKPKVAVVPRSTTRVVRVIEEEVPVVRTRTVRVREVPLERELVTVREVPAARELVTVREAPAEEVILVREKKHCFLGHR